MTTAISTTMTTPTSTTRRIAIVDEDLHRVDKLLSADSIVSLLSGAVALLAIVLMTIAINRMAVPHTSGESPQVSTHGTDAPVPEPEPPRLPDTSSALASVIDASDRSHAR
jgi:hypothetical protein